MKLLHITVGFLLPVLSMAAVLQRDLVMPAPCVGIAWKDLQAPGGAGELEYQGFGVSGIDGQDPHYDASSLDTYSPGDLCDREVNGETVNCTGDITVKCVGYGVANYNGLSCRTICQDSGDPGYCYRSDAGSEQDSIIGVLICDQTM